MKHKTLIITTGFAMFSMFFGSGNLVFPIQVGIDSQGHFGLASLGIFLTGVFVPFLGALAVLLYRGESHDFFATMGEASTFFFPLIALSLMGPFGVAARCVTVAHGSFVHLYSATPLWLFSVIMCGIIYLMTMKQSKVLDVLGTYLTPVLLISMGLIILFGIVNGTPPSPADQGSFAALSNGLLQGYQTMDLIAAFFFSTYVVHHLPESIYKEGGNKAVLRVFIRSALIGAGLLAIIYFGMVYLGNAYFAQLSDVAPEQLLGAIAYQAMGPIATIVVCIAVVLACFTTAVVLNSLFAEFFQQEVARGKISERLSMLLTLAVTVFISTLEFSGIARVLGPILQTLYPALIVLTAMAIAHKLWGTKIYRSVVVATFLITLGMNFW